MGSIKGVGYSRTQWIIFCVLGLINILTNLLYSMQASIFPIEAQKKNATATEFGFVFGCYELTQLIMSPIVGILAPKIGIFRVFNIGILVTGISTILFGFLQFVNTRWIFILVALLLRVIESIGACAICVTIYIFIVTEFSDSMATTIGAMDSIVGFSFSIGPFVGSALFQFGGFILPFSMIGGSLIFIGGMVYFLFHNGGSQMNKVSAGDSDCKTTQYGIFLLLKNVPSIYFYMFMVVVGTINLGFILTLLTIHLEQFHLTPIHSGFVFLLLGVAYSTSTPIFSWLCGFIKIPELIPLTGTIFYIIGWILIGPAPFVPLNPSLGLTLGGVALMGCGGGCILSSGFILSIMATENYGLSDDVAQISSQISGIWLTSSAFGSFIGPVIGGLLYDYISFPLASLSMIGLDSIQIIFLLIFIVWKRKTSMKICSTLLTGDKIDNQEKILLIPNENINKKASSPPLKLYRKEISTKTCPPLIWNRK